MTEAQKAFVAAFIDALIEASRGDECSNFTAVDLAPSSRETITKDCLEFLLKRTLIDSLGKLYVEEFVK